MIKEFNFCKKSFMQKKIQWLDWQEDVEKEKITSIDSDLILLEKPIIKSKFQYPFKTDMTTAQICLSGHTEGYINLKPYISSAPSLTIILPDQILQHKYMSDDFSGLFIVMSKKFIGSLNIQSSIPLFRSINDNPTIPLSENGLNSTIAYYNMLKESIQKTDNPYRLETVKYLTLAFFYGASYAFHKISEYKDKSKNEMIVDKFLELVKENYRQERHVVFYAGKLCLTPKYLASLIKANTGQSANDWIDQYVVLEAKALLKSTNMTVQQVSDELNFPSQSFFGKYFKRLTTISPGEYKKLL